MAADALDEGTPGLRSQNHRHDYIAYFRDPDGKNGAFVHAIRGPLDFRKWAHRIIAMLQRNGSFHRQRTSSAFEGEMARCLLLYNFDDRAYRKLAEAKCVLRVTPLETVSSTPISCRTPTGRKGQSAALHQSLSGFTERSEHMPQLLD